MEFDFVHVFGTMTALLKSKNLDVKLEIGFLLKVTFLCLISREAAKREGKKFFDAES